MLLDHQFKIFVAEAEDVVHVGIEFLCTRTGIVLAKRLVCMI